MGFLYAIFSPVIWFFSFLYSNFLIIFVSLVAVGFGAFLLSYYLYGFVPVNSSSRNGSPKTSKHDRKVTTIVETDEENDRSTPRPSTLEQRRMRKRDWAKKLYTSFVDGERQSDESSNESRDGGGGSRPRRHLRRRHSTAGPLQMARELIRRGSRSYFRQTSDTFRDAPALPPQEFFEPTDLPEIPQNLQPEIFYILHNLKTLELPPEWKLDPRDIEVRSFQRGEYIVKPGDQDDSIYVAIEGSVGVYIAHMEGKEYLVKKINAGGNFFSLLSMLDILMNVQSIFRTVSLKAESPCKVAKFPITSFRQSYYDHPEAWTRPIQIVITRLLHVTMTTLHQYMGLSTELMKSRREEVRPSVQMAAISCEERTRQESGQAIPKKRERRLSETSDQIVVAKKWLGEALMISPADANQLLDNKITIRTLEDNEILIEQGSEEEMLTIVLTGALRLQQYPAAFFEYEDAVYEEDHDDEDTVIYSLYPKELFGGLQLLTNEPSFYTARAVGKTIVGVLQKQDFYIKPMIYLPIAHSVLRRLSPFLRGVDYALDWILLDSGHPVYRAGDTADSMFVVLSGRLRSVEKKTVVEEFGRGDVLGMMEVLQRKPRSTTVMAVRYSQLARVPEGLLNFIKLKYPQVGFRLVQLLGQYYTNKNKLAAPTHIRSFEMNAGDPMSHIKNLHTIAVVPASSDVPLVPFTCELYHALSTNLKVLRLSSQKVGTVLDSSVLEKNADFRLMHWLNVQEDTYQMVIYECDYAATNWTRRCLRQADAILVVANGGTKPQKHSLLRELLSVNQDGVRTNKELILLWPEHTPSPRGTYEWLKNSYFSGHHHVRAPKRMFQWMKKSRKSSRDSPLQIPETEIIDYYEKNVFWTRDHHSDFARLARILTGHAIGLVLGGGGARGAAHVGVIRAIREQGIPIDIVGGTSIGSLIGGIFAETPDERIEERAKGWFDAMTSLWRKILDLTWAHSAMFRGVGFNTTIQDVFGEQEIEDLWIPYFCISTDISTSDMRVHRSGPLWAYVRASMSLAGYLPPLCDPQDGHLLLDGGYVNNLPADVMKSMGARTVIAVDVGSVEETNLYNYGDSLNGFWILWNKWNPWAQPVRVLNMEEIQSRLAYVSCVRQLETVKKASYCQYLRPSIDPYKTLDFHQFNIIQEVGYDYGKKKIDELAKSAMIRQTLFGDGGRTLKRQASRREKPVDLERSSSFTDMAAAMSKVPTVRPVLRHSYSAVEGGQVDEFLDDLAFLDHSDADSEVSSHSDFHDEASETDEEEQRSHSSTRTDTPQPSY